MECDLEQNDSSGITRSLKAFREWGQAVGKKYITRINQLYAVKDFHEALLLFNDYVRV